MEIIALKKSDRKAVKILATPLGLFDNQAIFTPSAVQFANGRIFTFDKIAKNIAFYK